MLASTLSAMLGKCGSTSRCTFSTPLHLSNTIPTHDRDPLALDDVFDEQKHVPKQLGKLHKNQL